MADEATERTNQPTGEAYGLPDRTAGQGEFGIGIDSPSPTASKDASQEVQGRGQFDTFQENILSKMVELTRDQNPDWIYVYSNSETPIPDDYCMDTILDVAMSIVAPTVIPAGIICMWSGLLINIPVGWALCDGAGGTPDMRNRFVKGTAAGVDPGAIAGAATHNHPAHIFTQPNNHSNHVVTQPNAHSDHAVTQPNAHANHVVTQPSNHTTTTGSLNIGANKFVTSETHSGTAVDAHSAHAGTAVDSHSAHAGTAVDAHSAHAGGAVNAHTAANSEPAYYEIAYIIKL
jgi:hypothetical protein